MRARRGSCPRCGAAYDTSKASEGLYPALSRRDNRTDICSRCGTQEALEDAGWATWTGPVYWEAES